MNEAEHLLGVRQPKYVHRSTSSKNPVMLGNECSRQSFSCTRFVLEVLTRMTPSMLLRRD